MAFTSHLASDEFDIDVQGKLERFSCDVVLHVERTVSLLFKVNMTGLSPLIGLGLLGLLGKSPFSIHLVKSGLTCEVFFKGTLDDSAFILFTPTREPNAVGSSSEIISVKFDLINFPGFLELSGDNTRFPKNCAEISFDGWQIKFGPARVDFETEGFQSMLYSLSHSCVLNREGDQLFTSEQATEVLNTLHDALSFAVGQWIAPVFVRGYGVGGELVWQEWGTRPLHPKIGDVETWFDTHNAQLNQLIAGLDERRKDADWQRSFHQGLYWYLRAKTAGIDGGIVLLQSALELLCWQTFVLDRKALSKSGFNKLPAEDQIRLLVEACGIPVAIPPGLGALSQAAKRLNLTDGPAAMTYIRNRLVHPAPTKGLDTGVIYDAWRLASWYVELVLLRKIGYRGVYSNQTKAQRWVGDVEPVPWT